MPDDPEADGNPASKSGLNYRDIAGDSGVSRDNAYYIDGINVTDNVTGTFGANMNTEIIQEQKVLTGGLPAEFVGVPGLVSNVITKSGSNQYHGSANYFFQSDGLQSTNKNFEDSTFSRFDTAVTLGGPVIQDKMWFFASYRRLERDDDVVAQDTGEFLRTVATEEDQWYGRLTWSPTSNDTLALTFLNDPFDRSGRRERDITNADDRARVQGGNRYSATYSRLFGNVLLDLGYNKHNGEVSDFSVIREDQNIIAYHEDDIRTQEDEILGWFGEDILDQRDTELYRGAMQWSLDRHIVKFGAEFSTHVNFRDRMFVDAAEYTSLANKWSGIRAGAFIAGSFTDTQFDHSNASDYNGFIATVNASPNRQQFYDAFDTNGDGVISSPEIGANLVYSSTAGNPHGAVNYDRNFQSVDGEQETKSKGLTFFVQDSYQITDKLVVNAGVRAERWEHFDTTGASIYTFDWTLAPRISAAFDLKGDGRQKITGYWGRYYDPIRNNMTNFAGSVSGRVREEQVYALDQWVTYRTRGGPAVADALFAPSTRTPYTDDAQLGYQIDLGQNMSFEAIGTWRRTRQVLEDYDMSLYTSLDDGSTAYPGPLDHPDSLFLGLDYFGYSSFPDSNFVIATLAGGKRDYKGVEFVFRKRLADSWQGLVSYTFNKASGNTNSDSNADFQGDVLWLDPRAPNQLGDQPGNIGHIFKVAGSYEFNMGLQLGATVAYNSGTFASRTFSASRRNLPARVQTVDAFEFAGINARWLAPDSVGTLRNPAFALVDLRVQYRTTLGPTRLEIFGDVFNLFDNQNATREQDLLAGTGLTAFGDGIKFSDPRRLFLGARVSF